MSTHLAAFRTPMTAVAALGVGLALLAGCNDEPTTTPIATGDPVVQVNVEPGADFEARSAMAEGPGGPFMGPLIIRGTNLHYDDLAGTLVVDLTVENAGDMSLPEPIALVFTDLLPDTIGVVDADNDETGPGAKVFFSFEDGDAMWTPGEESLPRTISFDVDPGVAIAFAARIEAGMPEGGGSIGGLVWNDLDQNGEVDEGEPGIPGVMIVLTTGFGPKMSVPTGEDGRYVFEGLAAGTYTVAKPPRDDLMPTTPPSLTVLLSEVEGEVSSFLDANFGCLVVGGDMPPVLEVGDFVSVTGEYAMDPDRIVAMGIELECDHDGNHDGDDDGNHDGDWGDGHDRDGDWARGEIRGPVTDIDLENRTLSIMGTAFAVAGGTDEPDTTDGESDDPNDDPRAMGDDCGGWWLHLEDIEIGDRVRARVIPTDATSPDEPHVIVHLKCWNGQREKVRGWIESIDENDDGDVVGIRVLHMPVEITPETEIHYEH